MVFNPVRTRTVRHPEKYRWSSYRGTAGLVEKQDFLSTEWILRQFGKHHVEQRYQEFVLAGIGGPSPWEHLRRQVLLGSDDFVANMEVLLSEAADIREFQLRQRRSNRPTLNRLFSKAANKAQQYRVGYSGIAHIGTSIQSQRDRNICRPSLCDGQQNCQRRSRGE